jgi:hypothetical protein
MKTTQKIKDLDLSQFIKSEKKRLDKWEKTFVNPLPDKLKFERGSYRFNNDRQIIWVPDPNGFILSCEIIE